MDSKNKSIYDNTSTPKRRRLGTGRILRPHLQVLNNINRTSKLDDSPNRAVSSQRRGCDSPLPCNQIEYLYDSNNSSTYSIPCSPGILDCSIINNLENWECSVENNENFNKLSLNEGTETVSKSLIQEIEDVSDDMFRSKLEQESTQNELNENLLTSQCAKQFIENIEESFENVNKSICELQNDNNKNVDKSSLFETKDSFLLDIKESGIVAEKASKCDDGNNFYGLPIIVKSLFKSLRNIDKFYDWQEECLNLDAIKARQNLIYALPTSGGKTLVAEVLMLREVLNRKQNALFILPFVAIVQEKIWSLSPFALQLDFLVEEYAAGKGHIPPVKRRKKNSIYIATIEKGLALIRSLIELDRLHEIGLIVVDELHLIGEEGRGGTLETLLSTVIFANKGIQIVGMSATIGNLHEIARFLRADVFQREFRPVELKEYVKLGNMLYRLVTGPAGLEVVPDRQLTFDYSAAGLRADPDLVGGLVSEVAPAASCLVFCATKRNAENVAALLCKLQRKEMTNHRVSERAALESALRAEGASSELARCVRFGVAWHHAGLATDERVLLEHAFRSGVICVLCCTSTLAAGVNLPAARVIVRAPRVGREPITLAAYRQMAGRAGRAGVCDTGESILICSPQEWPQVRGVLSGGLCAARSQLAPAAGGLLLSAVALGLASTRGRLRDLLACTLLHTAAHYKDQTVNLKSICDDSLRSLLQSGAVEVVNPGTTTNGPGDQVGVDADASHTVSSDGNHYVYNNNVLAVSKLGKAAIKGCMELSVAKQLMQDLEIASRSLVLMGGLHLLYLVTPHDAAGVRPDYRHYYSLYCNLDEEGVQTAKILGITEMNAIRMMTGKPITNVPEMVLRRFYIALMLHDLWKQVPFPTVAEKYNIPRGTVQSVMCSSAALAAGASKFCEECPQLWSFRALFSELAPRLQHCAAPEIAHLLLLPAVKKARALQLMRAGYKRVEDLAKASIDDLVASVAHLSRTAANHLISAARLMLIERVENLRAEAEDVMEDLKV